MGEQFAIAFDIAVILILVISAFVGLKRGFARVVLGLVSVAVAFAVSFLLSDPIAQGIYSGFVEKPIEEQLDSQTNALLGAISPGSIAKIDFEKVMINGTKVSDYDINYAGRRLATIDLTKLDLSKTGLTAGELAKIGISETSLSNLNAKTAEFSMDDIEKYGLGKLAVAQYIAVNLVSQPMLSGFDGVVESVNKFIPNVFGNAGTGDTVVAAIRSTTLQMLETGDSFKTAVMDGIVKPNCTLLIRTIVFGVLFVLMSLILRILMSFAKLINKIPVLGTVNSFLGLVLGLAEGLLTVFIVCLVTRLVITLSGANTMVFNQTTIDATFLFKTFYDFDFLNFLT